MGFIKEWADKLGVKIVCSQVQFHAAKVALLLATPNHWPGEVLQE